MIIVIVCIHPTPLPWIRCGTRSISKQNTAGLDLEFFRLCDRLPYESRRVRSAQLHTHNLSGVKRGGLMPFQRALALMEMQTVLYRIWICVVESFLYMFHQLRSSSRRCRNGRRRSSSSSSSSFVTLFLSTCKQRKYLSPWYFLILTNK